MTVQHNPKGVKNMDKPKEYRIGSVVVRIHAEKEPNREALEAACIKFMRAVEADRMAKREAS